MFPCELKGIDDIRSNLLRKRVSCSQIFTKIIIDLHQGYQKVREFFDYITSKLFME